MKEYLEAFERMTEHLDLEDEYSYKQLFEDEKIIKQALLKAQEQEKVLEIIKRVYTDLCFILSFDTFEEYNRSCDLVSVMANLKRVNKEEFDLLKRCLGK